LWSSSSSSFQSNPRVLLFVSAPRRIHNDIRIHTYVRTYVRVLASWYSPLPADRPGTRWTCTVPLPPAQTRALWFFVSLSFPLSLFPSPSLSFCLSQSLSFPRSLLSSLSVSLFLFLSPSLLLSVSPLSFVISDGPERHSCRGTSPCALAGFATGAPGWVSACRT
jgi:hypothetical protein